MVGVLVSWAGGVRSRGDGQVGGSSGQDSCGGWVPGATGPKREQAWRWSRAWLPLVVNGRWWRRQGSHVGSLAKTGPLGLLMAFTRLDGLKSG